MEGPYNEIKEFLRRYPEKTGDVLETLGYFDTVCFADQIAAPIIVSLGTADTTCHPESVRNLYNRIESMKLLMEIPGLGHERSTIWRYLTQKWFDFYL